VYYVWETRRRSEAEVMAPSFAPTMKDHQVSFIAGRRFVRPLPELEIRFQASGAYVLSDDLVIRQRRCLVHSHRLAEVLRGVGVDSIDYYPCRLVNTLDRAVYQTHQAANLLDVIHCMDRERSELDIDDEEPHEIWYINRLKLIDERLGDSLMFRLGERRNTVIVHESVKQAVEQAGLRGPVFLPADGYREYQGYSLDNPRNVIGTHDLDPDGPADALDGEDEETA
jgi:hypothetical protein